MRAKATCPTAEFFQRAKVLPRKEVGDVGARRKDSPPERSRYSSSEKERFMGREKLVADTNATCCSMSMASQIFLTFG